MDNKNKFEVLSWLNSVSWEEKYDFFYTIMGALSPREVRSLENMAHNTRRVSKRKGPPCDTNRVKQARGEPVPLPVSEPVPSLPGSDTELPLGWWSRWSSSEILSFDCEHVHLKNEKGTKRIKAATVAVYNAKKELLYEATVKHEPGSFLVNKNTILKNGFQKDSLVIGKPLSQVKEEVEALFDKKLIIHFNGATDFSSLGLQAGDYDNFDLQCFYRKPLINKYEEDVGEKISLRTLYWTFFKKDIQAGVHSAKTDALATLRLFLKNYIFTVDSQANKEFKDYTQFADIIKYNSA